jgi:hypothetical protein
MPRTVGDVNPRRAGIAFFLVGILAACGPAIEMVSPSPSPSSSAAPTTTADATAGATAAATASDTPSVPPDPTASPVDAPQVWQNWALATVRVNGLNVRIGPGPSEPFVDDVSGQFNESDQFMEGGVVRLNAGDRVLVMGVAGSDDGRQLVQIGAQRPGPHNPVVVGWAAAGTAADPWIDASESGCPGAEPSFETLLRLSGIERMGCYGGGPLSFVAYQATLAPDAGLGGMCGPTAVPWLQCDHVNYNWVNRTGGHEWEFLLHFDPGTDITPPGLATEGAGRLLSITGHFGDPQATLCAPSPPVTNEDVAQYLSCATSFVVESME